MGIIGGCYQYIQDLTDINSCRPRVANHSFVRGRTQLNLAALSPYLNRHPHLQYASYVHYGILHGVRIGFRHGSCPHRSHGNHPSSDNNLSIIANYLREEDRIGRLVGSLAHYFTQLVAHTSPTGLIPKPHSDSWRLIVDLTSPWGSSVNAGISTESCSLQYVLVNDAVSIIRHVASHAELVKMDLSNASRIVPLHPDDQLLLGISWQGSTFVDRALPLGLCSAPKIFTAVADCLAWSLRCEGVRYVIHYLDNFLIMGPQGSGEAAWVKEVAISTFNRVDAPVAHHKTNGPSTFLSFLGTQIDTASLQLTLPQENVVRLQLLLDVWIQKKGVHRRT